MDIVVRNAAAIGKREGNRRSYGGSFQALLCPRRVRFAHDSLLEGDGFELPVPRTTPGFWPISTRTTRRDRCRKKGVRIRQLLVFAALGREWWARRRSVLSVSDPRERAAREPAGADRAPSSPSSARCASNRMLPAPGCG